MKIQTMPDPCVGCMVSPGCGISCRDCGHFGERLKAMGIKPGDLENEF